jgi:hypothetical protein
VAEDAEIEPRTVATFGICSQSLKTLGQISSTVYLTTNRLRDTAGCFTCCELKLVVQNPSAVTKRPHRIEKNQHKGLGGNFHGVVLHRSPMGLPVVKCLNVVSMPLIPGFLRSKYELPCQFTIL